MNAEKKLSCTNIQRLLKLASKSKNDFLKAFGQFGQSGGMRVYIQVLSEMEKAVAGGDVSSFKAMSEVVQWIHSDTPAETLAGYCSHADNPLRDTSFVILACKYNSVDTLRYLLGNSDKTSQDTTPGKLDDEGHNVTYYAIRSGNVELLEMIVNEWLGGYFTDHPDEMEQALSVAYEELKLKNVLLSDEMKFFVQTKLLNLRFFSKVKKANTSPGNIVERIHLVLEKTRTLRAESSLAAVDDKFIYITLFVVQNIHILKQQLKSTYNVLPWEEMEFFLVSFISAHTKRQELNIFIRSVLSKGSILEYLDHFSNLLGNLIESIKISSLYSLGKPIRLNRDEVIADIINRNPSFRNLYSTYQEIRDVYSLQIMKRYIDAALLAECGTREGQLTIKRALQVMGEHLKNSLESPKLSEEVSELLLLSAPRETRKILTDLRNSLSKTHFLQDEETDEECKLYTNVQNDINKVGLVITDILFSKKIEKIKSYLIKIIASNSLNELNEILEAFQDVSLDLPKSNQGNQRRRDIQRIVELVNEIDNKIVDKTNYEKEILKQVNEVLQKLENKSKDLRIDDYVIGFTMLQSVNKSSPSIESISTWPINSKVGALRGIKCMANQMLVKYQTSSNLPKMLLKLLTILLLNLCNCMEARGHSEITDNIYSSMSLVNYINACENDNLMWVDEFRERLSQYKPCKRNVKSSIPEDQLRNQLKQKLSDLGDITSAFSLGDKLCKKFSVHDDNHKTKFMLEMILLDILSILDSSNCLANNALFLDDSAPLLSGKCLRNHLAHGNALFDLMFPDILITFFSNAKSLTENIIINFSEKIGNVVTHDIDKLKQKYDRGLQIINRQEEMTAALGEGNFEKLKRCLKEGADTNSRCLNLAARGPNLEIIKYLLNRKIKTNEKNITGQTPLHVAAAHGRADIVQYFVNEIGSPINEIDNDGKTPLHLAAQNGHRETVEILLSLGASRTVIDTLEKLPVHCAVENNHIDVVRVLLELNNNVDENEIVDGYTCLHRASEYGRVELVQYLLRNNADVNAKTKAGVRPIHLAALNGNSEIMNALINKGAQVNLVSSMNGGTPLLYAVENSHEDSVRTLLEQGAFVNISDYQNHFTPLHKAATNGHQRIVELLIRYKANVNAVKYDGTTPLLCAAAEGHLEVVKLLIQNGALTDSAYINGWTALHLSAMRGHNGILRFLIEKGSNIHIRDKHDQTPLHLAVKFDNQLAVDILLAEGADVTSATVDGSTPLHFSARNGNEAVSTVLIKKGASLHAVNVKNFTPLHVAVQTPSNENIIKLLIKLGADVNVMNTNTPLHVASFMGYSEAVNVLIKNNAIINAITTSGDTPLHFAVEGNHKAVVEILVKHEACTPENISTALCSAVQNNYGDLVDILIAEGADVNIDGGKPLKLAISKGYRGIAEALLKNKNIDIDVKDNNGHVMTLLNLAAANGNWNIGKALIKKGAKIDLESYGFTPLSIAVSGGHKEFVDMLLSKGADVDTVSPENYSLLHTAVSSGHPGIVETLLSWGANCNIRDGENRTALELTVAKSQLRSVKVFFQHRDININERGNDDWTLLHIAVQSGNLETIKFLVSKGANVDAKNMLGSKPIHIAAREGFVKIVEFFLECGISIGDEGAAGQTLLHYAALGGQAEVAQCLIRKCLDINAVDENGLMASHIAAREGHLEVLNILFQSGAMYDATDKLGRKPVHLIKNEDILRILRAVDNLFKAVQINDVLKIEGLINNGVPVNVRNADKSTLLHLVCWKGYGQACDMLLKNKANPNVPGKSGNAPLHYAAKFSHLKSVQSLLKSGAKYNVTNDNGKTPLDFATEESIIYLLELVDRSFRKVESANVGIINDLKNITDIDNIKAVMKARNEDGKSLVVVAIDNNFPKVNMLKQILQKNITLTLVIVENMLIKENFTEALCVLKKVLNERREILGEDNPGTLDVLERIAFILYQQFKYSEALELFEEIYQKRLETLGPNNKDSLRIRSGIALILHRQGKDHEAVDIFQDIYRKQKETLGENHLDVLRTRMDMALSLDATGKYEEALKMNYENYEKCLKIFGAKNPFTLNAHNNIASVLSNLKRCDEAFVIYQKVYETRKIILGPNHSATLRAMSNMGVMLMEQHRLDEALKIFQEVLAIQKIVLGSNHKDTLYTQTNIGILSLSQNKVIDAVQAFKASADQWKTTFGTDHPRNVAMDSVIQGFDRASKITEIDIDRMQSCQPAVITAASEGDIAVLKNLIQNGSDVNTADAEGRTPLHFAANKGHLDVLKVLLKSGADATAVTTKGNTALHTAASWDSVEIAKLLLQNVREMKYNKFNDFINASTVVGGSSAMHVACKKGCAPMVKCLLKHGARYNPADRACSATPVQYSQSPDVTHLLQLTLELFVCAEKGDVKIIKKLLAMETDDLVALLNARDEHLRTPLQVAIVNEHKMIASCLGSILKNKN